MGKWKQYLLQASKKTILQLPGPQAKVSRISWWESCLALGSRNMVATRKGTTTLRRHLIQFVQELLGEKTKVMYYLMDLEIC